MEPANMIGQRKWCCCKGSAYFPVVAYCSGYSLQIAFTSGWDLSTVRARPPWNFFPYPDKIYSYRLHVNTKCKWGLNVGSVNKPACSSWVTNSCRGPDTRWGYCISTVPVPLIVTPSNLLEKHRCPSLTNTTAGLCVLMNSGMTCCESSFLGGAEFVCFLCKMKMLSLSP